MNDPRVVARAFAVVDSTTLLTVTCLVANSRSFEVRDVFSILVFKNPRDSLVYLTFSPEQECGFNSSWNHRFGSLFHRVEGVKIYEYFGVEWVNPNLRDGHGVALL